MVLLRKQLQLIHYFVNSLLSIKEEIVISQMNLRMDAHYTLYFLSFVNIVKSLNSNWIVLTSDTELSGPHLGACTWPVYKLTSEKGIFDLVSKQGSRRSPNSFCK